MSRNLIYYVLTVVIFCSLVWFVLDHGAKLEIERNVPVIVGESGQEASGEQPGISDQVGALSVFVRIFCRTPNIRSAACYCKSP